MRTIICLLLIIGLSIAPASAAVLTFDDLEPLDGLGSSNLSAIDADDYGGFVWTGPWTLWDTDYGSSISYANAATSEDKVVIGFGEGFTMTISNDSLFDFEGAWFTARNSAIADTVSEWVNITAYDLDDNIIGSTGEVALGIDPIWVAALFGNVSYLVITAETGSYAMDDFTYSMSTPSEVPIPAALPLFFAGLAGLAFAGRRQKQAR